MDAGVFDGAVVVEVAMVVLGRRDEPVVAAEEVAAGMEKLREKPGFAASWVAGAAEVAGVVKAVAVGTVEVAWVAVVWAAGAPPRENPVVPDAGVDPKLKDGFVPPPEKLKDGIEEDADVPRGANPKVGGFVVGVLVPKDIIEDSEV